MLSGPTKSCAALLMAIGFALAPAAADEPAAAKKETPEHKVLARYIGDWDEEMTILPSASTPAEMKVSSQNSRRWLLKETMVENKGARADGTVEFLHLVTYDASRREYRQCYFDSNGATPMVTDRGKWDETKQTLRWKSDLGDGLYSEGTTHFTDPDHFEWTLIIRHITGTVQFSATGKATRRK